MATTTTDALYSIATLPKPLDSQNGKFYASPVYGLRGSRKRKRHEVAVGIDGEGVNIYDIQSQNLISSHALPPQTYICCPPTSVFCKLPNTGTSQRRTYLLLRNSLNDSKPYLVCFTEDVKRPNGLDEQLSEPVKSQCTLQSGEILSIDAAPSGNTDTEAPAFDLIATYRNGNIHCISSDLSQVVWKHDAKAKKGSLIDHATILDLETARKGLLLNREDALAALEVGVSGPQDSQQLMMHVSQLSTSTTVRLYTIRTIRDDITTRRPNVQLILEYELPARRRPSSTRGQYHLHAASGVLYQLLDECLTVYDLTGTTPRIQSELGSRAEPINSFSRISSSSVIVVSGQRATVYETKYGSIQQSTQLSDPAGAETQGKKRKRIEDETSTDNVQLVTYFSNLGAATGLSSNKLTVIPLAVPEKRSKTQGTLLVDVLGRGITASKMEISRETPKGEKKANKWEEWKTEVNRTIKSGHIADLERVAADALKLKSKPVSNKKKHQIDSSLLDPTAFDLHHVDRRKVLYLLSKSFRIGSDDEVAKDQRLFITSKSESVIKWLALTGYLTFAHIQQAFQETNEGNASVAAIQPGDVMRAVRLHDMDFQLMHDMLALPVHWEIAEVVQALKLLVQSFETADDDAAQLALPAPGQDGDDDTAMANGESEQHLASESRAAETELDHAMSTLFSGLQIRSDALRMTLTRLHAFPQKVVTNTMRTGMTRKEIIFFIHILRLELADGGWTTRYADTGDDQFEDSVPGAADMDRDGPNNQAIRAIGDMLNCAVDAIGTSGWLVGLSGDTVGTEELVHALRAEVSAGVEGCYEADTLHTVFAELDKYADSVQKAQIADIASEDTSLPVNCRAEPLTIKGRNKDGKKAKHMLAREKSMRVGKYSIDRIRI